ncbi:MAG: mandelate racemase [Phycisphaeraceae bacterium]|nr:mandelate racemase [Phycisphaeraceae bacterium]
MRIESIDFFYVSMPQIEDIADGSQDALLVRVRADGLTGWGECEASPLVCIANWVCPMSHEICKPLNQAVANQVVDGPEDIARIARRVARDGLDIAQTDHTFSGVEIALWDLLGNKHGKPVYELLGYDRVYPKTPYASQLFGDTPDQTRQKARASVRQGFKAVKFGWGPYGLGDVEADRLQVEAAREGLGPEGILLVDAGTAWGDDPRKALPRLEALEEHRATWLEEPFVGEALEAHAELAAHCRKVRLAGGEGARNIHMARHLIDYGKVGFIQIDTGRIGGIGPSKKVCDHARAHGVTYVNHTFTTHLALSASLQPFSGVEDSWLCEYPVEPKALAVELNHDELALNDAGQIQVPARPGLGVEVNLGAIEKYLVETQIKIGDRVLYRSPDPNS